MASKSLHEWLSYQETLHPENIELGLDRVSRVWQNLEAPNFPCPVILVGGTNGKGSTVACLESIYGQAGYKTACYTSPHINLYNERVRISGQMVSDVQLVTAFEQIDRARNNTQLTYFEFGTLAALLIFAQIKPDVVILEVGLGGRLDAVNIIDPDLSVITNIALDHTEWLGESLDQIAIEKAGIARQGKPLIIGQQDAPQSLLKKAIEVGASTYLSGRDFLFTQTNSKYWAWRSGDQHDEHLPLPALQGEHQLDNCAAVLCAIHLLASKLPVSSAQIHVGLTAMKLAGRFEVVRQGPMVILDVAHNLAAANALAKTLEQQHSAGMSIAILAMQSNRELLTFIHALKAQIDLWYVCELQCGLGHSIDNIKQVLRDIAFPIKTVECSSIAQALEQVLHNADSRDRLIVTGSFYTVAEARNFLTDTD